MLFNSPEFAVFLLITLAVYHALGARKWRLQNLILLVASYFFYGWWDVRFLSLIAISTGVDYLCGLKIEANDDRKQRKRWLILSMVTNLGILGVFKYFDFFIDSAAVALEALGFESNPWALRVLLPPGISFYTFQTMSYTIDIHRGRIHARRDFLSFALFVAYFPQLVAGPIERASHLLPQMEKARPTVSIDAIRSGLMLILIGLFKKVVIADMLATTADESFGAPEAASSALLISGLYAFAIQIYCDFSAYSDIARGVSRLLGIELIRNFETPYLARNVTDFWRRWHISLSSWLRDYLYIPLGGNRKSQLSTYRNLLITMLLGGLWHGAAWAYVIWGALHGIFLAVHRFWCDWAGRDRVPDTNTTRGRVMGVIGTVVTFQLVCLAWIFFRAGDSGLGTALVYLQGLFALRGGLDLRLEVFVALGGVLLLDLGQRKFGEHAWPLRLSTFQRRVFIQVMLLGLLLAIATTSGEDLKPFIYFQF